MISGLLRRASGAPPPKFVSKASTQTTATVTTLIINVPAGVQAGHLMLAYVGSNKGAESFGYTCAGWDKVFDGASSNSHYATVFSRVATGSEPASYTFTATGAGAQAGSIVAYKNAKMGFFSSSRTNPPVAVSVTPPTANCLLLSLFMGTDQGRTFATPGGMTSVDFNNDSTGPSWALFSEPRPTSGATGTRTSDGTMASALSFYLVPAGYVAPTPALVGSAKTLSGDTAIVISKPTGVVEGDVLFQLLTSEGGGAAGTFSGDGFTSLAFLNSGSPRLRVAYKIATGSEPSSYTSTYTLSGKNLTGAILAYRGGGAPTVGAFASAIDPVIIAPSMTIPHDYCRLLAVFAAGVDCAFSAVVGMNIAAVDDNGVQPAWMIAEGVAGGNGGASGDRSNSPTPAGVNRTGILVSIPIA